ncbi:MAG: hypothetical protein HQK49_15815 [Oligoflexia bacterium]|nr:hypothetical protein [Oligoflexia bacterium]
MKTKKMKTLLCLLLSIVIIAPASASASASATNFTTTTTTTTINKYKEDDTNHDHQIFTKLAAKFWGLSDERIKNIALGAKMPDITQSGFSGNFNQQWSHGLLYGKNQKRMWGDADQDFEGNLMGNLSGNNEGWNHSSADIFYSKNDQKNGDWYIGYASHYIVDVTTPVHSTNPLLNRLDVLTHHFDFELWIANNLEGGHRLLDAAINDKEYYTITDPRKNLQDVAWKACYWNIENGYGKILWDLYKKDGYPTKENSGSPELVDNAKIMIVEAVRWARGTIKWGLDQYNQWADQY